MGFRLRRAGVSAVDRFVSLSGMARSRCIDRRVVLAVWLFAGSIPGQSQDALVSRTAFAELLKIPLKPPEVAVTVHSTRQEEDLVLEDISWPAVDGEQVPAYLVRPAKAGARMPAVVCLHGTGGSRDALVTRQFGPGDWQGHQATKPGRHLLGWARELARRGYVTIALTQRGLDNRLPDTTARDKALLVHGRNVMGEIVSEIRQAITYLEQRPEVARDRIGVTGISFGGITGFYTWLVDARVAAVAPICGGVGSVETFIDIGSRGYHGIYWWVPGMLTKGDQADFAAALAPRPIMLWAPLEDIGMPRQGVDRFLKVVEPAYRGAGASGKLVVHQKPGVHEFSLEAFEALVKFFADNLQR